MPKCRGCGKELKELDVFHIVNCTKKQETLDGTK